MAATHTRDVYYGYDVRDAMTYARFDGTAGPGIVNNYDGFGRMLSSTNSLNGTRRISYAWDAGSRRTQVTHPSGYDFGYDYDSAGHLTGIRDVDAATTLFTFTYDALGRINLRTDVGAGTVDHGFDRLDRLASLAHTFTSGTGNVSFSYGYNPASQMETRTRDNDAYAWNAGAEVNRPYGVNALNQYTSAGSAAFTYDRNGNLTGDGTNSYTYDVENRLVAASGGRTIALRYDPLGRLYETVGASGTRRMIWDGDALVTEYTETGALAASYVHGTASGDDPLMWRGGGENRRIRTDHQGSVIAITNGAGAANWTNGYDEWGIPGTANAGRFQYTGQIWLADLGMYHYKARIYSPTLGRFLQTDPVGYDDGVNLYAYAGNDPVNRYDPNGEWSRAVHNRIFDQALGSRLDSRGMSVVRSASLRQDLPVVGNARHNYMHFLRDRGESVASGRRRYESYVRSQIRVGRTHFAQGDRERALAAFARAAHAVQDSYSPAHQQNGEPQEYTGVREQGHSPLDSVGREGTDDLTPDVERRMIRDTRRLFDSIFNERNWNRDVVQCIGSRLSRPETLGC